MWQSFHVVRLSAEKLQTPLSIHLIVQEDDAMLTECIHTSLHMHTGLLSTGQVNSVV